MKTIAFNKCQSRWNFAFTEYDFEIKYCFEKNNSVDEPSRRLNYKKKLRIKFVDSFYRTNEKHYCNCCKLNFCNDA